ncbi:MAG TPA: winged helix-turn-helix domain-containing protein [Anaerohalosphaeraceae bacterium]|nr:winged helix-turn-helix domain-containing protein [Anaerohalosphaeraceae bacterium]
MKKSTIKAGEVYGAKVSGNWVKVRIIGGNPHGGWDGINLTTKKQVRIKSGARLHKLHEATEPTPTQTPTNTPAQVQTKTDEPSTNAKPKNQRTTTKPGGLSCAVRVLQEEGRPLSCPEMVKIMLEKGYWQTDGKTPAATIYSAIITEIKKKGDNARFRKAERGKFELAAK